jgi:hypothetical protein
VTIEKRISLMLAYYGAVLGLVGWVIGYAIGTIERLVRRRS